MLKSPRPFPAAAAAVCLAGLLFCLWVFFTGGSALCLTDGCTLFQDFRLAGISLWQAGIVLFAVLLALTLPRLSRAALLLAASALTADIVLLGIMIFTAPCVNCLVVGGLIALSFLAFRNAVPPVRKERSTLLLIWLVLLVVNVGSVLRDLAEPWTPLPARQEQASVHVYFSPSCRACQTLLSRAGELDGASWYPVPEDSRDIWIIAAMADRLEQGMPVAQAVEEARKSVPDPAAFDADAGFRFGLLRPDMLLLQFRLWRNHAHVLAAGSDRLPFVEFLGLPAFLVPPPASAQDRHGTPAVQDRDAPAVPGLDVAGFCDGESETPCQEPGETASGSDLIDTSGMLP